MGHVKFHSRVIIIPTTSTSPYRHDMGWSALGRVEWRTGINCGVRLLRVYWQNYGWLRQKLGGVDPESSQLPTIPERLHLCLCLDCQSQRNEAIKTE